MRIEYIKTLTVFVLILLGVSVLPRAAQATEQQIEVTLDRQSAPESIYKNMTSLRTVDLVIESNTGEYMTEMKLSETGDFDNMAWESYTALKYGWEFSEGDGHKSIYGRYKSETGEIYTSAHTFIYDTTPPEMTFYTITKTLGPDNQYQVYWGSTGQDTWGLFNIEYRVGYEDEFSDVLWEPYFIDKVEHPFMTFDQETDGAVKTLYIQFRDPVGNATEVMSDTFVIDKTAPTLKVTVPQTNSRTADVQIISTDARSSLGDMWISNDPQLLEGTTRMPYQETVSWTFDDRNVVWVKVADSVGNVSEPVPAFKKPKTKKTPGKPPAPFVLDTEPTSMPVNGIQSSPTPAPSLGEDSATGQGNTGNTAPAIILEQGQQEVQNGTAQADIQVVSTSEGQVIEQAGAETTQKNALDRVIAFFQSVLPFWQ